MGKDCIRKYLAYEGKVAITLLETTELVENAKKIHDLSPTATAALGRLLTATAILGQELKNEDEVVTTQIKGSGEIGTMVAVSNYIPEVKGYVQNPHVEPNLREDGKLNVGKAVGNEGFLTVIKDIGLKEPYIGISPLVSGEIAEDFAKYFVESEQKNNALALGVLVNKDGVKRAGGYQISLMPGVTDEIVTKLEENLKNCPNISELLEKNDNLDEIAKKITGDVDIKFLEENRDDLELYNEYNNSLNGLDNKTRHLIRSRNNPYSSLFIEDYDLDTLQTIEDNIERAKYFDYKSKKKR